MEKRQIVDSSLIIFIILIVTQLPGCSTDSAYSSLVYPKGKGTESNPFHVTSVHQLQAIDVPEHLNMHYIQMGDMDSIGDEAAVFEGSSEGITGLTTDQMTGTSARQFMPEFDWDTVWRTTVNYPVLRWQDEK